jgi:hypothetical protein
MKAAKLRTDQRFFDTRNIGTAIGKAFSRMIFKNSGCRYTHGRSLPLPAPAFRLAYARRNHGAAELLAAALRP